MDLLVAIAQITSPLPRAAVVKAVSALFAEGAPRQQHGLCSDTRSINNATPSADINKDGALSREEFLALGAHPSLSDNPYFVRVATAASAVSADKRVSVAYYNI